MNLPPWLNPLLSVERKWRYFFNHLRVIFLFYFPGSCLQFPWFISESGCRLRYIRLTSPPPPPPRNFVRKSLKINLRSFPEPGWPLCLAFFLSHRRSNKNSTTSVFETGVCLLKRTFQVLKKWTQASLKSKLVIGVQDQHRRSLSCKGLRVQPGSNLIEQNNPIVLVLLHFACDWSCYSLNQSDANLNQSRLGRPRFPALW